MPKVYEHFQMEEHSLTCSSKLYCNAIFSVAGSDKFAAIHLAFRKTIYIVALS